MTHTPEEIIDKLGQLSPNEIARLMRDEGVGGLLRQAGRCPISNYVNAHTSEVVSTGRKGYFVFGGRVERHADLPKTVKNFVEAFDRGDYPDLIH